jgi:hypothetical protein
VSDWLNLPVVEHRDVAHLDEDAWYQRHLASVESPVLDGRRYPGFPDESTQKAFVGSAYGAALDEGARFYRFVRAETDARRTRLSGGRYLDFGAGWGRIGRFFLRDFERGDMAGWTSIQAWWRSVARRRCRAITSPCNRDARCHSPTGRSA